MKIAIIEKCWDCVWSRGGGCRFSVVDGRREVPGPDCPLVDVPDDPNLQLVTPWVVALGEAVRCKKAEKEKGVTP